MSKIDNGGPAFPFSCQGPTTAPEIYYGLTMRDYFAAKALAAVITGAMADGSHLSAGVEVVFSKTAYMMADAMLRAREAS